ncbi:UDP-N-acetylenolpyruvoylglucosamine reductase [beta proteobacterium AAP99]|nr:UDP-N-acetylenolpyruvoylglucosamine reductase [beta proteobacterium AAP99]
MPLALETDRDLQPLNSFGLPGHAAHFITCDSVAAVQEAVRLPEFAQASRRLVLGGGSNLVITGDFPGCVLAPRIAGFARTGETTDAWLVEVGAGELWHATVARLLDEQLPGLENLALIPGSVGAAPIQNIGAYGLELTSRFDSLQAVEISTGALRRFSRADCAFAYRDSVFKREAAGRFVIVSVTLALPKRWAPVDAYADLARGLAQRGVSQPSARDIFEVVVATRRAKLPDPAVLGNAGSFFKNPVVSAAAWLRLSAEHPEIVGYPQADGSVKLAAAWLIDRCGFKGQRRGAVGVHERQALVLVHHGGGRGSELLALAQEISGTVQRRFGVQLEPEPVVV